MAPAAALMMAGLCGCAASPRPSAAGTPALCVARQAGGLHRGLEIAGGWWYQTRGDELLVLDASDGREVRRVRFGEPGRAGEATDLLAAGDRLHVVLHDDGVATLDISDPAAPRLVEIVDAASLEIMPRGLCRAGDDVYVLGEGGAVRLRDRSRVYVAAGEPGSIVDAGGALVATSGRRAYRVSDAAYLGSASTIVPLPESFGQPGLFVFTRDGEGATELGLMTEAIREVNAGTATVRLAGRVHAVAFGGGQIWAAADDGVRGWGIEGDALIQVHACDIAGVRDLAMAGENHLAWCGEWGRGILRIADDGRNPGGVMVHEIEAPGRIVAAQGDGRSILAFDGRRHWLYDTVSNELRLEHGVSIVDTGAGGPDDHAATLAASARIDEDGRGVTMTTSHGQVSHTEPQRPRPRFHCVAAVDGRFWVGHERGVTVLAVSGGEVRVIDRLRLPGPVIFLMPLPDGSGAAFVSEAGGFGVVEYEQR